MKRSEINSLIQDAIGLFKKMNVALPPFAYFTLDEWKKNKKSALEIFDLGLGWDITDFGSKNFKKTGLLLFTIRNGKLNDGRYPKPYAEKLMIVEEEQETPMHFHWHKMEDIINRGGGDLLIEIYNATKDDKLDSGGVHVSLDGIEKDLPAGSVVRLRPGESICLTPRLYHRFYAEKGKGKVVVGEVSMVNDDTNDNRFYDRIGRFPDIEEDEPPRHLLCNDYDKFVK